MGCEPDERGRGFGQFGQHVEQLHRVTLSHGFYMAKYPTTQRQYEAVMGNNPSEYKGEDHPVEITKWRNAIAFCEELNELQLDCVPDGYAFRLPTESEWESACRSGARTALNSGVNLRSADWVCQNLDEVGWYWQNAGKLGHHAVGCKRPNARGLYDMHGNVWEVVQDWYREGYATRPVRDPVGPGSGDYHVMRGGSWSAFPRYCRSASRAPFVPRKSHGDVGFRVVLALIL